MTALHDLLQAHVEAGALPGAVALLTDGADVEDGRLGLDDPIDSWLLELASPMVVRTPEGPVDDVVPAARAITVRDLLESRAGWGFTNAFD